MTDYIDWVLGLADEDEDAAQIAPKEKSARPRKGKRRAEPDAAAGTAPSTPLWGSGVRGRITPAAWTAAAGFTPETAAVRRGRRADGVNFLESAVAVRSEADGGQGEKVVGGGVDAPVLTAHRPGASAPTGLWAAGGADLFEGIGARHREAQWISQRARQGDPVGYTAGGGGTPRPLTPGEMDEFFQRDARRYDSGWQEAVW